MDRRQFRMQSAAAVSRMLSFVTSGMYLRHSVNRESFGQEDAATVCAISCDEGDVVQPWFGHTYSAVAKMIQVWHNRGPFMDVPPERAISNGRIRRSGRRGSPHPIRPAAWRDYRPPPIAGYPS